MVSPLLCYLPRMNDNPASIPSNKQQPTEPQPSEGSAGQSPTSGRKRDHVDLVVRHDVRFRGKTTGLERYEFIHNALPEIDLEDVDTSADFLGFRCSMPLLVSSMTGGYSEAERINRELAEVCEVFRLPMGVGSQRQATESSLHHASFRSARVGGPSVPIFGNLGGAEVASPGAVDEIRRLADLIEASAFAVHLNPLQELMQLEGNPRFRGVLNGIERLVKELELPIIVKEVGAGLSADVIQRLLDVGVRHFDVAGAGGTSWSGVELIRRDDKSDDGTFWDWGIPTAEAVVAARRLLVDPATTLIASGGIASARDIAVAVALGADFTGAARPLLKMLLDNGQRALHEEISRWRDALRGIMFLTGSATVGQLAQAPLSRRNSYEAG